MWLLWLMTEHEKWNWWSDGVIWPDMHFSHAAFQRSIWNPWIIKQKMFTCMQLRKASFYHLRMPFPANTIYWCAMLFFLQCKNSSTWIHRSAFKGSVNSLKFYNHRMWTFFWEDPKKVWNHSSGFLIKHQYIGYIIITFLTSNLLLVQI